MEFDFALVTQCLPLLIKGAGLTLQITALAVGIGLVLGLILGMAQLSRHWILHMPAKIYVDFIRGTPLLIQIFIIYFALPNILGTRIDPFVAAVTACSMNSGAYIAEIFRGGIQSISQGQMRAGLSLGMTYGQTMRYIILPQAFKRIIPPLGNEFIAMLKDSSLVSVIGFEELTRSGGPARHRGNLRDDRNLDLRRAHLPHPDALDFAARASLGTPLSSLRRTLRRVSAHRDSGRFSLTGRRPFHVRASVSRGLRRRRPRAQKIPAISRTHL